MKIIREVNGKIQEFELTEDECRQAYIEQQKICDMEDCGWEEGYDEEYNITKEKFEELLPDIADRYREIMGWSDEWIYARDAAIDEIIGKYHDKKWNCFLRWI